MIKIDKKFFTIVIDILENPKFQELKYIKHHGNSNTVYEHSIRTAYFAYRFCKECNLKEKDLISTTRATLLHDFFDANWKNTKRHDFFQMHAFQHGNVAAQNAEKYFHINSKQKDAIANHMFPLTKWPHHKEGWIVTFADKVVSIHEISKNCVFLMKTPKYRKKQMSKNNKICFRKNK